MLGREQPGNGLGLTDRQAALAYLEGARAAIGCSWPMVFGGLMKNPAPLAAKDRVCICGVGRAG